MLLRFYVTTEFLSHGGEHLLPRMYESCRERKSACIRPAVSTSAGTASSSAAWIGPAAFAGILHESAVLGERGILGQRPSPSGPANHELTTLPRRQTSAMSGQVEIVADIFGKFLAGRVLENVKAFRVGLHSCRYSMPVVDHLYEMAGA